MSIETSTKQNRQLVQFKLDDIKSQLNEIEQIVNDLPLEHSDHNFISEINSVKYNLDFYFSNWDRGRGDTG
jgi:tetrahydromethanopterin S-methyltransferase subunit B